MPGYGTSQSDSKTSTQIDTESDASSDHVTLVPTSSSSEETPLIQDEGPVAPRSFRRLIIVMAIFIFLLKNINAIMKAGPMLKIMEDIICREYYPDHLLWVPDTHDQRCKDTEIQKTLAMVKSWSFSSHLLVAVIVQIPYGIIADKYGRRPILCLSMLGCLVNHIWVCVVLYFPDRFSIWSIVFSGLTFLIGGGVPIANAMIYTLVTDVTPASDRSTMFSRILATVILPGVVLGPVCAFIMQINPWIPMWIAFGADTLAVLIAFFVPETLHLRRKLGKKDHEEASFGESYGSDDESGSQESMLSQIWTSIKDDFSRLWTFVIGSRTIMLFIITFSVAVCYKLALSNYMLQYMTKRFNWEWSTATYISTVYELSSSIVFMWILPGVSSLITNRFGLNGLRKDLLLLKVSVAVGALGALLGGATSTPWIYVLSIPLGNLGDGYIALFRGILNALVEPHAVATLNTTISTVETLFQMVATPAFGWLLGKGMELGGTWLGLPYFVGFCCGMIALSSLLLYRIPKELVTLQS